MREKVWMAHSFDNDARKIFAVAEVIAEKLDCDKLRCSHVFAACVHLAPVTVHKLLGRDIARLPDKFKLEQDELNDLPADSGADGMEFDMELGIVFIEDTRDSAFRMIRDYVPERRIGAAEIAFAILKEPSEEVCDILLENDFPNDAMLLDSLIRENYLTHILDFVEESPRERLTTAIDAGDKFEKFMRDALCGQRKVIEEVTSELTEFWQKGKNGKPLVLMLLSKPGGGRSFFADRMQAAFVELGLQDRIKTPLDLSGFLNDSGIEADLLGDSRSFRNARCGELYNAIQNNRRGIMVFEDIQGGSQNAKNILRSFACNLARDKFYEETMRLPFNVLVFTMQITDDQYKFLQKNGARGLDAKLLNRLFRSSEDKNGNSNSSDVATSCASLWQCADRLFLLEQLTENELRDLMDRRLDAVAKRLQFNYGASLEFCDKEYFFRMLVESETHELAPGELADLAQKAFEGLWKLLNRNPGISQVRISCAELPEYAHEPERRIVRGDYLVHSRHENCIGECLELVFDGFRYVQQERVDCGNYRIEHPKGISFDDLVGLDDVRDELLEALHYITHRDEYTANIPAPCLDFILYGPPGTGKTSLAVALANMADIPVFFAENSIYTDAGEMKAMFQKAADMAPAIVVLDEFNSIGDSTIKWKRDAINELLAFLDGTQRQSRLLVLASTNHLEQIEKAFLRWGRFGRQIKIDLPTAEVRRLFIRKFEEKFGFSLADEVRQSFVKETDRISFADLKGVLGCALRSGVRTGRQVDGETLKSALSKFIKKDHKRGIGFMKGDGR